jgi:hypothetical protein
MKFFRAYLKREVLHKLVILDNIPAKGILDTIPTKPITPSVF